MILRYPVKKVLHAIKNGRYTKKCSLPSVTYLFLCITETFFQMCLQHIKCFRRVTMLPSVCPPFFVSFSTFYRNIFPNVPAAYKMLPKSNHAPICLSSFLDWCICFFVSVIIILQEKLLYNTFSRFIHCYVYHIFSTTAVI